MPVTQPSLNLQLRYFHWLVCPWHAGLFFPRLEVRDDGSEAPGAPEPAINSSTDFVWKMLDIRYRDPWGAYSTLAPAWNPWMPKSEKKRDSRVVYETKIDVRARPRRMPTSARAT